MRPSDSLLVPMTAPIIDTIAPSASPLLVDETTFRPFCLAPPSELRLLFKDVGEPGFAVVQT